MVFVSKFCDQHGKSCLNKITVLLIFESVYEKNRLEFIREWSPKNPEITNIHGFYKFFKLLKKMQILFNERLNKMPSFLHKQGIFS